MKLLNHDSAAHNLFSAGFDADLVAKGSKLTVRLDRSGPLAIHCNDHEQEEAQVLVVDGPSLHADSDGRLNFTGQDSRRVSFRSESGTVRRLRNCYRFPSVRTSRRGWT